MKQVGWKNWRRSFKLISDRKVRARVICLVYRLMIRPAVIYGFETWAVKKAQENKIEVAEMRMMR